MSKQIQKTEKRVSSVKDVFFNDGQVEGLPKNPRFIRNDKFKKLVKSIKEFPEMLELRPIVVDENMVVLGGNMRLKASIEAGLKEVPVIVAEGLTIDQKKEFLIKDNLSFGDWDLDDLFQENWDKNVLEAWGFDELIEENDSKLTQEEIDSKYDDDNCVYPLIPKYDEKHNAFIILVESETEEAAIRTKFGFAQKAQSYKNSFLGKSYIMSAKEILNK